MTIGDVACKAGIRASAIRYYERTGVLPRPARVNGRRRYDDAVLKQLAVVIAAREAGFTIREIHALVAGFSTHSITERRAIVERKLDELETILRRTLVMQAMVREMMACRCTAVAECGERILRNKSAVRLRDRSPT
jgi:MerR family redox-sensitive transcriptional activator SoxR